MKYKHKKAYMEIAYVMSRCSPAQRLQVGCVIVKNNNIISTGYNALPEHINGSCEHKVYWGGLGDASQWPYEDDFGRFKLETKPEVRHAEKNALMALTRRSESSVGASVFITHSPCKYCAIDLVDAGITSVYFSEKYSGTCGVDYLTNNGVFVEHLKKDAYELST